jgi:hypothetical protein
MAGLYALPFAVSAVAVTQGAATIPIANRFHPKRWIVKKAPLSRSAFYLNVQRLI